MGQCGTKKIIGVTGKGGSGKTAFVSLLVKVLSEKGRVLAIDGDSAGGLQYTLGVKVSKTIGDIRKELIHNPAMRQEVKDKPIPTVITEALTKGRNFELLVMGGAEGPGCYCHVNELLKYGIETLSQDYDFVLIDCEAGAEQISRRILDKCDVLLIMVDNSARSMQVARVIRKLSEEILGKGFNKEGLVINRYRQGGEEVLDRAKSIGLDILGCIPEDSNITEYDRTGRPLTEIPETSPSLKAVEDVLDKLINEGEPINQ